MPLKETGRIFTVAHTQSEDNEKGLFSGWRDPDLTPKGIQDAGKIGEYLASVGVSFDRLVCSPQTRAMETMRHISMALFPNLATQIQSSFDYLKKLPSEIYDPQKSILEDPIIYSQYLFLTSACKFVIAPELMEQGYGVYAGKSKPDMRKGNPDLWNNVHNSPSFTPTSGSTFETKGENFSDVISRLKPLLDLTDQIIESGKNALYVWHSNTERAFMTALGIGTAEENRSRSVRNIIFGFYRKNGIYRIESEYHVK